MEGKAPPVQVAVSRPSWAQVYMSRMQQPNAGSTRARFEVVPLCKLHLVAESRSYRLVSKMVLTLCNLRWWCFSFHQLAQILHLHSWCMVIATCAGGIFPQSTSAFTNAHIATCSVWWWLYICGGSGCTWRFCCCYTTEDSS